MKTNNKMSCIRVNDIFDELIDENQRLKQCLNVFIDFKTFVDFISTKIANKLEIHELQKLKDLTQNVEEVVNKFHENIGIKSNFNNVMKTPEKTGKGEKPEEVIKTKNTSKSVTDIYKSEKTTIRTKKSILNKSDEKIVTKPIYETIQPKASEETNINNNTNKQFICDSIGCNYQTINEQVFRDHHNIHSGLKPYECNLCDKTFHLKKSLAGHRATVHKNIGSIKCPVDGCERLFIDQIGSTINHLINFIYSSYGVLFH